MKSSPAEASGVEAASGPGVAAQQRPRTASQATTPSRATADDSEVVNSGSSDDPPQGTSQRPEVSARPTAASAAAAAPFSSRHGRAHDPRGGAFRRFREQTYDVFRPQPTLPGALAVLGVLFALGLGLGVPLLLASLRVVEIRVRYDNADPLGGDPNASLPSSGLIDPCGLRATALFNDTFTLEADDDTCGGGGGGGGGSSSLAREGVNEGVAALGTASSGGPGSSGGGNSGVDVRGRRSMSIRQLLLQPAAALAAPRTRRLQWRQTQPGPAGRPGRFAPLDLDEQGIKWPLEVRHLYGMYNATNLNSVPALRTGGALAGEPVGAAGHFHVWMRPSARPTALKLYGVLQKDLPAGCLLRLDVANRYNSYSWGGEKRVVLTTQSWYGMRNMVVPCALLAVAAGALTSAALLVALGACMKRAV